MSNVLRVRLGPTVAPCESRSDGASALLDPGGPTVILGDHDPFAGSILPSAMSMYGPRGAHLFGEEGPLWVADTGHHRLLGWAGRPTTDAAAADWVLGAPNFSTEGRNAGRDTASAATLNMPTGVGPWNAEGKAGLVVADSWNNRVLVWRELPTQSDTPADLVLGQPNFSDMMPNRGRDAARDDTMHWPFAALVHEGRLYVADAGNRRVLVWCTLPDRNGTPADFVLGQRSLDDRSDNGGIDGKSGDPTVSADARSMRWPHDLAIHEGALLVADAGNNRVLIWDTLPDSSNVPASRVLGQADFSSVDHNRGAYDPTAEALNMPYGLDVHGGRIVVADTANSRLLGYPFAATSGSAATSLTGQHSFTKKGDNRWGMPARDSLCWPYGLKVCGRTAIVSDTGNHRVLLWRLA